MNGAAGREKKMALLFVVAGKKASMVADGDGGGGCRGGWKEKLGLRFHV